MAALWWEIGLVAACLVALCIGLAHSPARWLEIGLLLLAALALLGFEFLTSWIFGLVGMLPERTVTQVLRFEDSGNTGTPLALAYICGSFTLGLAVRKATSALTRR
jgi:hypothetical protein